MKRQSTLQLTEEEEALEDARGKISTVCFSYVTSISCGYTHLWFGGFQIKGKWLGFGSAQVSCYLLEYDYTVKASPQGNSIWPANRPFFAVGQWIAKGAAKRGWTEGAMQPLGARPLSTTHTRPRSTARQPDWTGWESILLREENRNAQRKTLGVRLISIETRPTYERRMRSRVRRGGRHERYLWAILMSSLTLQIMNRETERL